MRTITAADINDELMADLEDAILPLIVLAINAKAAEERAYNNYMESYDAGM